MYAPGWYHAQGDPLNTTRYWDGTAWTGPALVSAAVPAVSTSNAAPAAAATPVGPAGARISNQRARASLSTGHPAKPDTTRFERLVSGGLVLLLLGAVLGICGHNLITLFSTPAQVQGTVTAFSNSTSSTSSEAEEPTFRIEITSNVGVFYASGDASSFPPDMRDRLPWPQDTVVTVSYSERTGGLVAIDDFDQDRRDRGQYLWPVATALTIGLALAKIFSGFGRSRDGEQLLAFIVIAFLVGPALGWALTGVLDSLVTSVMHAP